MSSNEKETNKEVVFDVNEIMKIIPHRYPFLLIDKIIAFEKGKSCVGVKNVTINEPFFQGHFPGHPIMPGVLLIEAMAQCGGILGIKSSDNEGDMAGKVVYFMGIDNAKFRKPVFPGDTVEFHMTVKKLRGNLLFLAGIAYVDGVKVAEADVKAMLMDE